MSLKTESGLAWAEYALLIALIAVVTIALITVFGDWVTNVAWPWINHVVRTW